MALGSIGAVLLAKNQSHPALWPAVAAELQKLHREVLPHQPQVHCWTENAEVAAVLAREIDATLTFSPLPSPGQPSVVDFWPSPVAAGAQRQFWLRQGNFLSSSGPTHEAFAAQRPLVSWEWTAPGRTFPFSVHETTAWQPNAP